MKTELGLVSGDCLRQLRDMNVQGAQQRHNGGSMAAEMPPDTALKVLDSYLRVKKWIFYLAIFSMNVFKSLHRQLIGRDSWNVQQCYQ